MLNDKIPNDKIPNDKMPNDKIPNDKMPNDKIPNDKMPNITDCHTVPALKKYVKIILSNNMNFKHM